MPANSQPGLQYDAALVTALFDGVDDSVRRKAVLPSGSRQSVVHLLTRLMVDADLRSVFCRALETERARHGVHVELQLLGQSTLEIREEEIAARGFAGLTDDELADIVRSPEAILALADFIDDPDTELGAWYVDALGQVVVLLPRSPDLIAIRATLRGVCNELLPGDSGGQISPRSLVDETRRRIHNQDESVPESDRLFYELAASELRRLIVDRARRAIQVDHPERSVETVSGSAASAMTLPMAERAPEHVLKMDQRLDELAQVDHELVRIYSLSEFAGRSPDEIAGMMGSLPGEIVAAVDAARTELSLIE